MANLLVPRGEPMMTKLSALQALQKLLASITEADLVTLVKEFSSTTKGTPTTLSIDCFHSTDPPGEGKEVVSMIAKLVRLPDEEWFQYEGLHRLLIHSSLDEILRLHATFPTVRFVSIMVRSRISSIVASPADCDDSSAC